MDHDELKCARDAGVAVRFNHPMSNEASSSVTIWNVIAQQWRTYTGTHQIPDAVIYSLTDSERAEIKNFFDCAHNDR